MDKSQDLLFIGNGINRCFQSNISWNEMLSTLSEGKHTSEEIENMVYPQPMKAIVVTEDNVDKRLSAHKKEFFGTANTEQNEYLCRLFDLGFENIITTNYSYELEMAALGQTSITEYALKKMSSHTSEVKHVETKYLLHSYNTVSYKDREHHIWHIHGEARKPDSMILGHYYYGNLIFQIKKLCEQRGNAYTNESFICKSWVDNFIMRNVYILGFGFDMNEVDLWWLLNRKKRERQDKGKIIFYDIYKDETAEHSAITTLLDLLEVDVIPYKVTDMDFRSKYDLAIADIKGRYM